MKFGYQTSLIAILTISVAAGTEISSAQDREGGVSPGQRRENPDGPDGLGFGPGGPGFGPPPGWRGFGFGPPGSEPVIELLKKYDVNQDGWLNDRERVEARKFLESEDGPRYSRPGPGARGPGGPGRGGGFGARPSGPSETPSSKPEVPDSKPGEAPDGRGGPPSGPDFFGGGPGVPRGFRGGPDGPRGRRMPGGLPGMHEPGRPGPKVDKSDVQPLEGSLYDRSILRTIFIDFSNDDWEAELESFHGTNVDVAATVTVDGSVYKNVGIRFRGASSYFMIPHGSKRSLNLSVDMADENQKLLGYQTLNLLNLNGDASMMSSVLYSYIARQYIPAPKANFVRVVINGELWGIYANVQQFNKQFLAENYPSAKGTRWKVSGSPQGRGGLEYTGENEEDYKRRFEMKTNDPKAWKALIKLCKTLNETPSEQLKDAIAPMLNIDETLWFLALDNALINSDGYWVRASDYSLFLDKQGVFHLIPYDMNESFRPSRGPGMGGPPGAMGPGGPGFSPRPPTRGGRTGPDGPGQRPPRSPGVPDLDPLVGIDNDRTPLLSKLLAVPELREQYLANIRTIANDSLDWGKLGPVVAELRKLIAQHVEADTRKLTSYEAFEAATSPDPATRGYDVSQEQVGDWPFPRPSPMSLRTFAEARSKFLLDYQPTQQK